MQQITLAKVHVKWSVILMDLLNPDIFSTLWTKGQVEMTFWPKSCLCFCHVWMKLVGAVKKIISVSESFWSNLKFFKNDRLDCVVVKVKCESEWNAVSVFLLSCYSATFDQFVGQGGGPLEWQKQGSHVASGFSEKSESSQHKRRSLRNCEKGMKFLTCAGCEDEYHK